MMSKPAVFLDRDGTVIREVGYLNRLDRIEIFPWSIDAVRVLNKAGFLAFVVTNQAGVARGYFEESLVQEAHRAIDERMRAGGAKIAGYYYCPHHPDAGVAPYRQACDCRKPQPGMVRRAEREFGIDPSRSFVVGDRWMDVEFGHAAGARSIMVRTGYATGEEPRPAGARGPDAVVDNLMEAVSWILMHRDATSLGT
jgi:D-glycero-D-manno-heptose 1,7-bisphosphate phosphatase